MQTLHAWRVSVKTRDFRTALFAGSGLLCDDLIDLLASVGPIDTKIIFDRLVCERWSWSAKYGQELFDELTRIGPIPPKIPKPKKTTSTSEKRARDETQAARPQAAKRARGAEVRVEVVTGVQREAVGKGQPSNTRNISMPTPATSITSQRAEVDTPLGTSTGVSYPCVPVYPAMPMSSGGFGSGTVVEAYGQVSYAPAMGAYPPYSYSHPISLPVTQAPYGYPGPSGTSSWFYWYDRPTYMDVQTAAYYQCRPCPPPGTPAGPSSHPR